MNMFMDEARLAARIRHPHVVSTLDLEQVGGGFFMVMEYVEGHGLSALLEKAAQQGQRIPLPLALRITIDVLHGLHAAHELRNEQGEPLRLVHRDVSPHNILIGVDGLAKVSDFGVALARERLSSTGLGELKGKFSYMAPEQISAQPVDRRADLFACGAVLWECLAGRRLFPETNNVSALLHTILNEPLPDLRLLRSDIHGAVYEAIYRALARDPGARYADALEFADALETAGGKVGLFGARVVGQWVQALAGPHLERLRRAVNEAPPVRSTVTPAVAMPQLRLPPPVRSLGTSPGVGPRSLDAGPVTPLPAAPFPGTPIPSFAPTPLPGTGPGAPPPRGVGSSTAGYLEHFGMSAPPFSDVRQPQSFWPGGPYAEALSALAGALSGGRDPLYLLGAPGSGRTFFTEMLRYHIQGLQLFPVEPGLLFGASPLLELCRRLGLVVPEQVSTEVLLGIFLEAARAAEPGAQRLIIALDEPSPEEPELIEELLRISRAAPSGVHLLLSGPPDLPDRLFAAGAGELLSSRAARVELRPMRLPEMSEYLEFRFRLVSRGLRQLDLPTASCQFLHARSGGLPRLINVYTHNAMVIAYLRQAHQLSVDTLRIAMKSRNYLSVRAASELLQAEGTR